MSAANTGSAVRARSCSTGWRCVPASCWLFRQTGKTSQTVEGLAAPSGELHPVQQAMHDHHGLQCGYCTPGILMTMTAFLKENPQPSEEEVREALSGNLCRCTGYQNIVDAMMAAADMMRAQP